MIEKKKYDSKTGKQDEKLNNANFSLLLHLDYT